MPRNKGVPFQNAVWRNPKPPTRRLHLNTPRHRQTAEGQLCHARSRSRSAGDCIKFTHDLMTHTNSPSDREKPTARLLTVTVQGKKAIISFFRLLITYSTYTQRTILNTRLKLRTSWGTFLSLIYQRLSLSFRSRFSISYWLHTWSREMNSFYLCFYTFNFPSTEKAKDSDIHLCRQII